MLPSLSAPLIKLRLDSLPRYRLTIIYAVILSAFVACFIGAFFSPEMLNEEVGFLGSCYQEDTELMKNCQLNDRMVKHPAWFTVLPNLNKYKQFFMLEVEALQGSQDKRETSASLALNFLVSVRAREDGSDEYDYLTENKERSVEVECTGERSCGSELLFYEPYLTYENYELKVAILNWGDVDSWLANIKFTVKFVNPAFTRYVLACKYLFFLLSLLSNIIYFLQLRSTPISLWGFETRFLCLLGLSCTLMNDPTYAGGILSPSEGWSVYSVLCVTQFIGLILSFWMLTVQRMKSSVFSLGYYIGIITTLIVLVGLLSALYIYLNIRMKYDPSFSWKSDLPQTFIGVVGAVIALVILVVCWMIGLTLRAMPTVARLSKRQVFLLAVNTGMLVITILGIAAGFFQPLPRLGAMLLITVAIYNLYIYLLQVLFVPTKEAVEAQFRSVELEGQIAQLRFEEEEDFSKPENRI